MLLTQTKKRNILSMLPDVYIDMISLDSYRWQDGAIVANNPTIFSIREAQLLWPDTKIDCLVSIGCGSIPTKVNASLSIFLWNGRIVITPSV